MGRPQTAVLINDTTIDRHHGCRLVVSHIHRLASHAGITITKTTPAHFDWRNDPSFRSSFSSADIVLVNGEGTIHHSAMSAEPLLAAAKHASTHNIPSALINSSWHSNCKTFSQMAKQFTLVAARESASANELNQIGVTCDNLPDLSILTKSPRTEHRTGIGYSDCVLRKTTIELARVGWNFNAKPLNILYNRRSLRCIRGSVLRHKTKQGEPALFNHIESLRFAFDMAISQYSRTEKFLRNLSSFKLVITGRFHIMMLCMALRVPFIVVASNTQKNEAALADAGLCRWRHIKKPKDIDKQLLNQASEWESGERKALDTHLAKALQSSETLFQKISQLA